MILKKEAQSAENNSKLNEAIASTSKQTAKIQASKTLAMKKIEKNTSL